MRKSVLLLMIGAVVLASLLFMLGDRQLPHTYHGTEVYPIIARPGEPMTITFHVTRWRDCPGTMHRTLTFPNGDTHIYDAVPAARGHQVTYAPSIHPARYPRNAKIIREFTLPRDQPTKKVPRGRVVYNAHIDYYCNFAQQLLGWPLSVDAPPVVFEIVD